MALLCSKLANNHVRAGASRVPHLRQSARSNSEQPIPSCAGSLSFYLQEQPIYAVKEPIEAGSILKLEQSCISAVSLLRQTPGFVTLRPCLLSQANEVLS